MVQVKTFKEITIALIEEKVNKFLRETKNASFISFNHTSLFIVESNAPAIRKRAIGFEYVCHYGVLVYEDNSNLPIVPEKPVPPSKNPGTIIQRV